MELNVLILLASFSLLIPAVFIIMVNLEYKKMILNEASEVYGLQINTIKIKYEILKDEFKECPRMAQKIENLIGFEKDKRIDLEKVKVSTFKIFDFKPIKYFLETMSEFEKCNNEDVKNLFCDSIELNRKIAIIASKNRYRINKLKSRIQDLILVLAYHLVCLFSPMLNKIDEDDIKRYDKDRSSSNFESSFLM